MVCAAGVYAISAVAHERRARPGREILGGVASPGGDVLSFAAMQAPQRRAFEALRVPGFRAYLVTFMLTMMADNIEHVISYWVAFQKFHSAALGGFAVVSHWLPYLLFSVAGRRAQRSLRLAAPHPDRAPRCS